MSLFSKEVHKRPIILTGFRVKKWLLQAYCVHPSFPTLRTIFFLLFLDLTVAEQGRDSKGKRGNKKMRAKGYFIEPTISVFSSKSNLCE